MYTKLLKFNLIFKGLYANGEQFESHQVFEKSDVIRKVLYKTLIVVI